MEKMNLSTEDKAQLAAEIAKIVSLKAPEDVADVMTIALVLLFGHRVRILTTE